MLTAEQVASEHPAIAAAFRAEGATQERERIAAVEAQLIPGHEALINTLKFDGKSGPGDAAMAVNAAEKNLRTAHASALASDAPTPLPLVPAADAALEPKGTLSRSDLDAQAKAHMAANPGVSYIAAVKHLQPGA